ncbi:MAG: gamma-glutamyltransferase [bacterium]|nr:gamma-glutamyltransferase [bacterium]
MMPVRRISSILTIVLLALAPQVVLGNADGMVVSSHHLASEIGARVLDSGGNAVDAAVATAFALAVVLPSAGNLGGGGFLVHHGTDGEVTTFDFREKAPRGATERMYLDEDGAIRADSNHDGPLAVGVPGTVAGLWQAHQCFGSLPWTDLVQPAVDLAANGFPSSWRMRRWLEWLQVQVDPLFAETRRVFLEDGEGLYDQGEIFQQPDLARTLARIRDDGRDGFYGGETARLLADFMAESGGLITERDLAEYESVERPPIHGTYHGYDIYGMGPPSSGGIALMEMLNILEHDDLAALGHNTVPYLHLLAETMRRAFADRAAHLGDPDFNPGQPVDRLTSKAHAAALRSTIEPDRASVSDATRFGATYLQPESEETTHLSVVDADRNAVALTYTLEQSYGSSLTVPGAGFLLNNEMGDFNPIPGHTNAAGKIGTDPNLIAPGKRMLSSMSPTIVARDGKPELVLGSPGGKTIINTVLQVILNVVDHGLDLRRAVDVPRIHHQWLPDRIYFEGVGFPPAVRRAVADRGHRTRFRTPQGRVMAIQADPASGILTGVADSRSFDGGVAASLGSPAASEGHVVNGEHSLYYTTRGSGDPIVVLHGGPGFDHRQFLPFIWELAAEHQVILYDQRGTGLSSGPVDSLSITIDTFLADLEAVRRHFGLERMNLLGHSWGGILAMHYAREHPDRLQSLILCSTTASAQAFPEMRTNYEADRQPGDHDLLMKIYGADGFHEGDPAVVEEFWRLYFKPYFPDQSQAERLDLHFTENTIRHSGDVARFVLGSVGEFDLYEDLERLTCPALVIHGAEDPMPPAYATRIHESMPGSRLVIVPDAGHWLFVDGTEVFTRSVLRFLAGLPGD